MSSASDMAAAVKSEIGGGSTSTPVPAAAPPAVFPGVVTSIDPSGLITVTMNNASVICESFAHVLVTGGETVQVLIYNNTPWVIGLVSDTQSLGGGFLPGDVVDTFSPATTRTGWLACNGQSVSTTTYARLFAVIGHTYGGSGASFNVPDARGKFFIGANSTFVLGTPGGVSTVSLSVGNMPSHSHANTATVSTATGSIDGIALSSSEAGGYGLENPATGFADRVYIDKVGGGLFPSAPTFAGNSQTVSMTNASTGTGTSFSVIPPYLPVNRWIKT